MVVSKKFIESTFIEAYIKYTSTIYKLPSIKLRYIDAESFLRDAKNNGINRLLIKQGIFKDFENEYPGFLVVYERDKSPLSIITTGSYYISMCYELANGKLNNFKSHEVREYLKHAFAHEITHIVEDRLKDELPTFWEGAKRIVNPWIEDNYSLSLAHETLAEDMADKVGNLEVYKKIERALWQPLYKRALNERIEQGRYAERSDVEV